MFVGYNKKIFGKYLKELRLSQNLTQKEVSEKTYITTETLRRIENGITLAQFRTLEDLSIAYKSDLLNAFMLMRKSNTYYSFYRVLDELIINFDEKKLCNLKKQYEDFTQDDNTEMFDMVELQQFKLLLEALEHIYDEAPKFNQSNKLLEFALKLSKPEFNIINFKEYDYSYIEYKCLLTIATNYGECKKNAQSNDILLFIWEKIVITDESFREFDEIKKLHLKILLNISYNYHYLENHNKVIHYANKGLELCRHENTLYLMHCFYYRLGISNYYLDSNSDIYLEYLSNSIVLLNMQNKTDLACLYKKIAKEKYNIDI